MAVKKILIVEDQALVRMYLCSCVEKSKECEVAGTLTRAAVSYTHLDVYKRQGYIYPGRI